MATGTTTARRVGVTAVHSLHRFVFTVPDLAVATRFYQSFGLDVRVHPGRIDLHTFGHPHRWGTVIEAPGRKKLQYVSFAAYPEDVEPIAARMRAQGHVAKPAHPLADEPGLWFTDPEGIAVQVVTAEKSTPARADPAVAPVMPTPGKGAAPSRSRAGRVRPQRLSHILMFSSDVPRSVRFYTEALGLRLSDHSADIIAFLHGAHASDHHLVAFAKSGGPGLHHSSWAVASIDDVGLGMQQMEDDGYKEGWGVGRHVIGSNYFRYIRDPWGSFAEYSAGIDFIPEDVEWRPADHPLEDSFYVWGPATPDYFIQNHEGAA
jgi:catechol 2,3-dioxygenase-like lactoylglutathione lyase family enzyme